MPDSNLIVGSIYKHPSLSLEDFNKYFQPLLTKISMEKKQILLLGDFNIDLLHASTDPSILTFLNDLGSHFLLPNIFLPTRITDHSITLIDNIFSSISGKQSFSGNFLYNISDHLPQFHLIRGPSLKTESEKVYKKDWANFDRERFILDFLDIDWNNQLYHLTNVDEAFVTFNTLIQELVDRHVPTVQLTRRQLKTRLKPWITPGILKSIDKRDFYSSKYPKTKDPQLKTFFHTRYKMYRNLIVSLIRRSKTNYYSRFFSVNATNMLKVWEGIREIIGSKSKSSPSSIRINGHLTTNPNTVADGFNDFFTTIADTVRSKIGPTNRHFSQYLPNPNRSSIFLDRTSPAEVLLTISSLSLKKSSGPHSIPPKILHLIKYDLSGPLSFLFNLSFESGAFPSLLKLTKVIPVFKNKGSPLEISNYRPISLLSNVEKILEKLMYSRMISFINRHRIFFNRQFGFRKSHSTSHALLNIVERIRQSLDEGNFACGVFVDLQKAFDTVDHSILISKLNHYGIRGIANDWFKSYLLNRSQFVSISSSNSTIKTIPHGVPQGSVLGPLLFLIYINDLHRAIFSSETFHFADDTHLLHFNDDLLSLCNRINRDLRSLETWLKCNKISLNAGKTEFIIFRSYQRPLPFKPFLKIGGKKIFESASIKYLGVLIDSHLNWKAHISFLSTKLSRTNGIISKLRHYVSTKTLINVYHALFNSHMQYGCQLWGLTENTVTKPIFILQKRALRLITFNGLQCPSSPLFSDLQILKVFDLVKCHNITFIHKYLNHRLPSDLQNFFSFKQLEADGDDNQGTRGAALKLLFVPSYNTITYGIKSFSKIAISQWNSLQRAYPGIDMSLSDLTYLKHIAFTHCLGEY